VTTRATLRLSFANATWNGQRFEFSTILSEDGRTIGWELRVTTPDKGGAGRRQNVTNSEQDSETLRSPGREQSRIISA